MSDEINAQFGFERAFGMANGNADADTKKNLTYTLDNIPLNDDMEYEYDNEVEQPSWTKSYRYSWDG